MIYHDITYSIFDLLNLWYNFFFQPSSALSLALFRICAGLVCVARGLALWKYADLFFGPEGLYRYDSWIARDDYKKYFSLFKYLPKGSNSARLIFGGLILSGLSLSLGFCSSLSCFVVYCLWTSINHRNMFLVNSGDSIFRILIFLCIFSGSGYALSVDNYLYNRDQWDTLINPWVFRLMQIQVCTVYAMSVYYKLNNGIEWRTGKGVHYSLNNETFNRLGFLQNMNVWQSWLSDLCLLAIQIVGPIGLWFKETNGICLVFLMLLHASFEIVLYVGLFGIVMMVSLLLFVDPSWIIMLR